MRQLSNGMWVRSAVGIGIYINESIAVAQDGSRRLVSSLDSARPDEVLSREPWVHLTNKDGTTLTVLPAANCGKIEQARLEDIPESRRPSAERGAAMGYL